MESKEEFVKSLGEGTYGSVDLFKFKKHDGSWFQAAVKSSFEDDYEILQNELQILTELRGYSRIVECYGDSLEQGFSDYGNKVYKLLLEYAREGSLSTFMNNYQDRKLPDRMIRDFTYMILEGLVVIHGHGYVHCDLKSDNVLVFPLSDSSYGLKICDFGISLEDGEVPHYWKKIDLPFVGTPNYMPPESLQDGVAKKTLDLWSLGCLVLEMYTGQYPWKGFEVDDIKTHLFDGKAPEIPEYVPCDAKEFIETCFARKHEDRGSAFGLLSHRFLRGEEEKKTEEIVTEKRKNSLLFKLKLKLKKSKSMDIQEKSMRLKDFSSRPPQFKRMLNKLSRLKMIHMKPLDSNLVSVH